MCCRLWDASPLGHVSPAAMVVCTGVSSPCGQNTHLSLLPPAPALLAVIVSSSSAIVSLVTTEDRCFDETPQCGTRSVRTTTHSSHEEDKFRSCCHGVREEVGTFFFSSTLRFDLASSLCIVNKDFFSFNIGGGSCE